MRVVNRYLISSWLKHFLIILGFFVVILIIKEAYNHFIDLLREEFSINQILHFFVVSLLSDILVLLPLTLFVSILLTFTSLQRTNQITILKSCGYSLFQISRPFFIIALCISAINYFLLSGPISDFTNSRNDYLEILEPQSYSFGGSNYKDILTYQNDIQKRLWFIESFNVMTFEGAYTILHQMNKEDIEIARIISKSSAYDKDLSTWTFYNGTEVIFDANTGNPLQTIPFKTKQFINLEENPNDFLLFDKDLSVLSKDDLVDLLAIMPQTSKNRTKYEIKYYEFFASPLLSVILVGISIPFAVRPARIHSMQGPIFALILLASFFIIKSISIVLGLSANISAIIIVFIPYITYSIITTIIYYKDS